MLHTCKNILITCMDFRLRPEIWKWMEKEGYVGDCDVVSVAGAGKGIADGDEAGNVLLRQIDVSCKLHEARQIIFLHHSDCGAYNSSYDFADAAEEKEKQLADMEKSMSAIKEKFPDSEVLLIWAELKDDKGEKIEFAKIN